MSRAITGILLAAGQSRRFGANKLLFPLPHGVAMGAAAARRLAAVLGNCIAVVDEEGGEVASLLANEGLRVVENPRAADGIGTSIACGVAASRDARGWVIALADMPIIPQEIISRVVAGLEQGSDIIAPFYNQTRGHPVGFSKRHAAALMRLHDDEGARHIIENHQDSLDHFAVHDKGVVTDIDCAQDIHSLR
jgi:molybdenum cofactor cytidylyltransferase